MVKSFPSGMGVSVEEKTGWNKTRAGDGPAVKGWRQEKQRCRKGPSWF